MVNLSQIWQKTRGWGNPGTISLIVLVLLFLSPIFAVFFAALNDSNGLWWHLFETVLPRYVANTLILMIGVGIVSLFFGVGTAWIVTRYDFPFKKSLEWMLLLPFAIPPYLIAYTYTDFLEYAGPVQTGLRALFGWSSARDYWFPEIRSMGGAMLVIGAVLYPYVYMITRVAIMSTPASLFEAAMLHNRSLFWNVALPLARPAIAAGLALVMMETISDFGTVEYFAIETLTLGIFNVWLGMNNLAAAAQIACFAFLFIIALIFLEKLARANRRFSDAGRNHTVLAAQKLTGWRAVLSLLACLVPIIIGFIVPVSVLLGFVLKGYSLGFETGMLSAAYNSVLVSGLAALLVMTAAAFMVLTSHFKRDKALDSITGLASIGYAFPGTILAIGVATAVGAFDAAYVYLYKTLFGGESYGLLTGTIALVVIACVVRFQAVGYGAITSGLTRLPDNMMEASRTLGRGFGNSLLTVILPLLKLSFVTGGMLVFVDVMKELPMTLLLRPFNFETLPTYVYQYAKDELLEEAALPALGIVLTGIIPVILMNAVLRRAGLQQR